MKSLRDTLHALPATLDDYYERTWQHINRASNEDFAKVAYMTLLWLSTAFQPVQMTIIQHAFALDPKAHTFDREAMPSQDVVLTACEGLASVDEQTSMVRPVREYSLGLALAHMFQLIHESCGEQDKKLIADQITRFKSG